VITAVERLLFSQVLQQTHGHLTRASEILGLSRATLRHKLRRLGMALERIVLGDTDKES